MTRVGSQRHIKKILSAYLSSKNKIYLFLRYVSRMEQVYETTTREHEANKACLPCPRQKAFRRRRVIGLLMINLGSR